MNNFFKNMLSSEDNISSKRVVGTLEVLVFLVLTCWVVFNNIELTDSAEFLTKATGYLGGGLLGLGLADGIKKLW